MDESTRIPIRFGALKPLFLVIGVTPSRSYLELDDDLVRVRMAWSFRAEIPRASIRSVSRVERKPWSIGVHGWRGRWLVNGARGPIVAIEISPPAGARVLGFRVGLRELLVSVEDPDAAIDALAPA